MEKNWSLVRDLKDIAKVRVFSGGACNVLDPAGNLLRNTERDIINDWLTERQIDFYDPQIHPDTHGMEYDFAVHHELEIQARQHATVNLYEVSPRTFGGVSAMEIAVDEYNLTQPTIIFFSDGGAGRDSTPSYDKNGIPIFRPKGIYTDATGMAAHYREYIKTGNRMRQYVLRMALDLPALTVTFNEASFEGDVVITPDRMHAVDIFEAVTEAASGKRVILNFSGGKAALDSKGNPRFLAPENPAPPQLRAALDQYVDEGTALRRSICKLVSINVFVRVVYTQRDAINALDDLLKLKNAR